MTDLRPNISIIKLDVSTLNIPLKDRNWQKLFKKITNNNNKTNNQDPKMCCL